MSTSACSIKLPIPMVFISHSSKDRHIAEQFVKMFEKENIYTWIDYNEINHGDSIPQKIEEGLNCADALLLIITDNSKESYWCRVEYETLLMKEIKSNKTLVFPILVGVCEPPSLLSRKSSLRISINQSGEVILDDNAFIKLCQSITETTAREKIVSLTYNTKLGYQASLLAIIISSALADYPVNRLYAEQIVQGKRMGELLRTVENFINCFDDIITEIITTVGEQSYERIDQSNRKLLSIYKDMKALSTSLDHIAKISAFTKRFREISEVCVKIENIEGIHLITNLSMQDKGKPLEIPDVMPREILVEGSGHFGTWQYDEIKEFRKLLNELNDYKYELKIAIAKSLTESEDFA